MSARDSCCKCNIFTVIMSLVFIVIIYIFIMASVQTSSPHLKTLEDIDSDFITWLKIPPDKVVNFNLVFDKILHRTHERYLSFSIDTSQIQKGLRKPSLRDKSLIKKISHLAGGYLRIGGTAADLLVFSVGFRAIPEHEIAKDGGFCAYEGINCPSNNSDRHLKKFAMSADNWYDINNFAKKTGLKVLFDLNVLLRNSNGWNSSNAELIMDFSYAYQYDIDWQLGNEPNSFKHVFGIEVTPESLASDYVVLRQLLNKYRVYNHSIAVGPEVTNPRDTDNNVDYAPQDYLERFLSANPGVQAVSWHHYNLRPNSTVRDFVNVDAYNSFIRNAEIMLDVVRKKAPNTPVWITETGSSYGGGAKNISDRFVASLLWADKLGAAAKINISLLVRQSLYAGSYSLLDEETLVPNPDYWVSVLYNKLVGTKVLEINCVDEFYDQTLRVYAHCSKNKKTPVVFGVNIANYSQGINLMLNHTGHLYVLTSNHLLSPHISLNGELLFLDYFDDLPPLRAISVNVENVIPIQPYSIFFLEVDITLPVCW